MLRAKLNSEPSQMSKLRLYAKVDNDFNPLTIIEEISSPYAWLESEWAPGHYYRKRYCYC